MIDFFQGDSGGPLFINYRGVPYLVGVLIYGGSKHECGRPGHAIVALNAVSPVVGDWINNKIKMM